MKGRKVNLFIVGAAKSGTTSIHQCLAQHKDVYAGPLKEPHYFAGGHFNNAPVEYKKSITLNYESYINNYKNAGDARYLLDSSVHYIYFKDALQKIKEYNEDARIIIILRNPVERIFSHYKMIYKKGQTTLDFKSFLQKPVDSLGIDLLKLGEYSPQLNNAFSIFRKENILLLNFYDMAKDEKGTLKIITDFLDIEPFGEDFTILRKNAAYLPRNQFFRYVHMDFFLTVFLKRIMPGNKFRHALGKAVTYFFYSEEGMDEESRIMLEEYYRTEIDDIIKYGVLFQKRNR